MTTFNAQVEADADDVYFSDAIEGAGTALYWNWTTTAVFRAGNRFNSVTVAQGALIEAGTLIQIQARLTFFNDMDTDIHADDVDDSEVLEGGTALPDRTLTTASVAWLESTISDTTFTSSPDITTVIQEVIDRGGWSSGNDLTIISVKAGPAAVGPMLTDTHEGDATQATKIVIIYTAGGESSPVSPRLKIGVGI